MLITNKKNMKIYKTKQNEKISSKQLHWNKQNKNTKDKTDIKIYKKKKLNTSNIAQNSEEKKLKFSSRETTTKTGWSKKPRPPGKSS